MHLKSHALGMAGAVLTAAGYVLCSAVYALWPAQTMKLYQYTYHNFDFTPVMGAGMTWTSFVAGLVFWAVAMYVSLALFAWLYNKMVKA